MSVGCLDSGAMTEHQARKRSSRRTALLLAIALAFAAPLRSTAATDAPLAAEFAVEVDKRLELPDEERAGYAKRLAAALSAAGRIDLEAQYVLLVDRSPRVQAIFVYWLSPEGGWSLVGASPVSTGRPGEFDHFYTPLGVFSHTLDNMDFRAEGTQNKLGIRGYGARGMRVYDFGWVMGERGWNGGGPGEMRLQMHATDPTVLEPRLGRWHSKGCIRIPAALDRFIDRHGLIDADYERAVLAGRNLWVLLPDRTPTPWAGRYLVVVDSERSARPRWAEWRGQPRRAAAHAPELGAGAC